MKKISRRAALAGVATLSLASAPARGTTRALRAPFSELDRIIAADRATWDRYAEADDAAMKERRDIPVALLVAPEDIALGIPGSDETIGRLPLREYRACDVERMKGGNFQVCRAHQRDDGSIAVCWVNAPEGAAERAKAITRAFYEHQARMTASPIQEAMRRAKSEAEASDEATRVGVAAICAAPAHTMAEISAKLRALAWAVGAGSIDEALDDIEGVSPYGSLLASIARDARRMARG